MQYTPYLPVHQGISMFSFMRQLLPIQLYPNQPRSVTSSVLLDSATKRKLIGMMPRVNKRLLKLKDELVKSVKRMSEECASSAVETDLATVRSMKNVYQDEIEDFVELYENVLENQEVLEEWTQEVKNVARELRKYTDIMRARALEVPVADVRPT